MAVGVLVGVAVFVGVAVLVGVLVGVWVGVAVLVAVLVGVGVLVSSTQVVVPVVLTVKSPPDTVKVNNPYTPDTGMDGVLWPAVSWNVPDLMTVPFGPVML